MNQIEYIRQEIGTRPEEYLSNNWLKLHGKPKILKCLRERRKREIRTWFRNVRRISFEIVENMMEEFPDILPDILFGDYVSVDDLECGERDEFLLLNPKLPTFTDIRNCDTRKTEYNV